MQFHTEQVAVGKRIEKAPRGVVDEAASFTNLESTDETTFPGADHKRVLHPCQRRPSKTLVSASDLHGLLAECIHDIRSRGGADFPLLD